MVIVVERNDRISLCGSALPSKPAKRTNVRSFFVLPEAWPWTTKGTYSWRIPGTTAYRYSIRTRRSCALSAAGDAATASSKGSRALPSCPTATYWCATGRTTGFKCSNVSRRYSHSRRCNRAPVPHCHVVSFLENECSAEYRVHNLTVIVY